VKHIPDGADFYFDPAFGFTGSAKRNVNARNHPMDPSGEEAPDTYVERARGGRVRKAGGGEIQQETLAAPSKSFGQAFAAARKTMLAGGPKTFQWNGKSYNTNLAAEPKTAVSPSAMSTRSRPTAAGPDGHPVPSASPRASSMMNGPDGHPVPDEDANLPVPPVPPDYHIQSSRNPWDFSNYSTDREATLDANRQLDALRAQQGQDDSTYVGKARGGRVHRAMGGVLGQTPNGMPGTPPQPVGQMGAQANPMSRATITMPVGDAAQAAGHMLQAGRVVGAKQAVAGLANAARMRQMQPRGAPGATAAMGAAPRPDMTPGVPGMAEGGHMTAAQRHALPAGDFALPGGRYPINDRSHAANAKARVSQFGSPEEKAKVNAAVARRYPGMGKK
jgi:hypothetical protein